MRYTALDGTPAARTPADSPYYYDRYALFRSNWKTTDLCLQSKDVIHHKNYGTYSLRLFHNKGQWFSKRDPLLVQILLSMILKKPVILTGIEEECHASNGYPCWYFWYREPTPETAFLLKAKFYDVLLKRDETFEEDMAINREIERSLLAVDGETGKDMKEEKDV